MVGLLMNGFFGSSAIIALDGVNTSVKGGWVDHNWKQLYIQFAYICATTGYSFVVSAIIAAGINVIPGLHLRSSFEDEKLGMDEVEVRDPVTFTSSFYKDMQIGEFATDYIEIRRDFADGFAPLDSTTTSTTNKPLYAAGDRHGKPDILPVHQERDEIQEKVRHCTNKVVKCTD